MNKSVTFAHPVVYTLQYLNSNCSKWDLIFCKYRCHWLSAAYGRFLKLFLLLRGVIFIHNEWNQHLVKPWMKLIEVMKHNHLHVYFSLRCPLSLLSLTTTFGFPCFFFIFFFSLHQPLAHMYIKQLNPDFLADFWFLAFTWRHFDAILWVGTDSQRPQTQENTPNLYCLMTFLGDLK